MNRKLWSNNLNEFVKGGRLNDLKVLFDFFILIVHNMCAKSDAFGGVL
jgi:hypothetical protein